MLFDVESGLIMKKSLLGHLLIMCSLLYTGTSLLLMQVCVCVCVHECPREYACVFQGCVCGQRGANVLFKWSGKVHRETMID